MRPHYQIKARLEQLRSLSLSHAPNKQLQTSISPYQAVIDELEWVLGTKEGECPMCVHPQRTQHEMAITTETITVSFLEAKLNWPTGTVMEHMNSHIEFDPAKSDAVEAMRSETINTLNSAEDLIMRMNSWLNEWEHKKDMEGITDEWIASATRLASECNRGLKLVGTLKKEIGVDSQILLAQSKVDAVMGILVDTLRDQPHLLDNIELQMATLKSPTYIDYNGGEQ